MQSPPKTTPSFRWVSQHWVEMTTQYGVFPVFYGWLDIQPSIDRYYSHQTIMSNRRKQERKAIAA